MSKSTKINDRQAELLSTFAASYATGMEAYGAPLGLTAVHLSGEGQALSGLIRRGYIEERNRIFYITEAGRAALDVNAS